MNKTMLTAMVYGLQISGTPLAAESAEQALPTSSGAGGSSAQHTVEAERKEYKIEAQVS